MVTEDIRGFVIVDLKNAPYHSEDNVVVVIFSEDDKIDISRADAGFLERRFIFIKVWGFALLILSHFS